jgi:predicted DNA-binding protein
MKLSRKMTTRLSDSCYKRLENYADDIDLSVGVAVRELVERFLDVLDHKRSMAHKVMVDQEV